MSKYILLIPIISLIISCAHTPKCGNPKGARLVLEGKATCAVRIRQVEIGSELKIPESLKKPEISFLELTWIDPSLNNGQIELGHFKLIPKAVKDSKGIISE